jgi:hypothetical protein
LSSLYKVEAEMAAASGQRDATKAQAGRANFAKIELRQDKANAPVACIAP